MFPLKDNIPNQRFPLVTVILIAINVVAYLVSLRHGGSLWSGPADKTVVNYGAIPFEFTHPGDHCALALVPQGFGTFAQTISCHGGPAPAQIPTWETAITAMFLHASFLHIGGNMLFLAIFGPNVENAMGRGRYLVFYLLGGLVALAAQIAVGANSTGPTLGASGAIAAVLGGYIVLYPRARILTLIFIIFFFTIVELPAIALLGFWFLEQLLLGATGLSNPVGGGGVAYFAHVGGFVFGLALVGAFAHGRARSPGPGPKYPVY